MVHRTSPFKLLLISAIITVGGLMLVAKLFGSNGTYVPGTTTEYHPTAVYDREAAAAVLDETGFAADASAAAENIFVPAFEGNEPVAIGTRLSHSVINVDKPTPLHAAISILGREDGAQNRAPLDIALVIDRSGSMVGEKMDYAKAASHALIDALGPRDQLSVVTYNEQAETLVEPTKLDAASRAALHAAINSIEPQGGTNISAGLERGRSLVDRRRGEGAISRVVMLSDGQANNGITGVHGLARLASDTLEQGVSVSTMGMGLDYDEDVMQGMATAGAGNYYFIENGAATESVFAEELGRLQSAVARNAVLSIKVAPGVRVATVYGFTTSPTTSGVTVPLDAFAAKERKDLLIEFEVDTQVRGQASLFTAELTYTDVELDRPVRNVRELSVLTTYGAQKLDVDVMRRVQQIKTINAFKEGMSLYDRGDRFAAADLIERQREENRTFLDETGLRDSAFERVDGKLADLAVALRKTDRHSTSGKWISKSTKFYANEAVVNQVNF